MLFGREAELAAIDDVLASARARRGRVLCFVGEAGIGKSRLLAEVRTRAADAILLEGAAWESPGAPPYWPWIQVLRAAEAQLGAGVRSLPGVQRLLGDAVDVDAAEAVEPAAARFALLDQVMRALFALAAERPLVIVLDDLHAADLPTLELLDLMCRELARAPIAIAAAWRDAELAARPDAARRLARVGRQAVALRRLSASEVTSWVGADGAAIHAASDGNPLFVAELLRARRGGVVPRGIATVLDDHLALVTPATRAVLAAASVLGRELDPAVVGAIGGFDADAVERALREATEAGLGDRRDERWVFRHVLLRDHLYEGLAASERVRLHRAAGQALAARHDTGAAHHLLAGQTDDAVEAARRAAARAFDVHAFEDAAALLAAALRALEARPDAEIGLRIDLRLELARARNGAGSLDGSQAEALRAAELSRTAGDIERFARSALAYSLELASGRRDPVMIELLEHAYAHLPPADSILRARITVRLAAALIPTLDPDEKRPYQLGDEALAMADRIGDDDLRMFVLRFRAHAFGFRIGSAEAVVGVHEVIELSDRLGRPLEALEPRMWVVNAHLSLGDVTRAELRYTGLEELLARLPQPHYRWRMPIVRATRAIIRGQFDDADRLIATARQIARDHDLDRARMCVGFAALCCAVASGSAARATASLDEQRSLSALIPGLIGDYLVSVTLAIAGRLDDARKALPAIPHPPPIGLTQFGLEAALLVDDRKVLASMIKPMSEIAARAPLAYGPSMSVVMRPISIAVGEALVRLGRAAEAIEPIERGLALARQIGSAPFIASGTEVLAAARGETTHVPELRDGAEVERALPANAGADLEVVRAGDDMHVRWRGRELVSPSSKGLDYLAALLARPGGEVHVSELVGDEDRGDAGQVIDAAARAAYKARIDDLREEIAEAEARNDLGRIDRLSAELEMVTEQIVSSTGLGGRTRRAGSRVERARVNVQRRIRDAIQRLTSEDAALGRYLEATIRTGTFCSFSPLVD